MDVKSARILFVEDDEDDYILTVEQLEKLDDYHFEIDWASSWKEALGKLESNEHDICLLDYQLGAYTGLDVLKQANALGSNVPIIMLTGQPDDELDKMALDAGAADFLTKGDITNARFARAIRYAISRVEIQKARQQSIDAMTESNSKDRFIAHLSHELRTPLTSILGYTELLINSNKANNAHQELTAILNNGKHLLSLLNDVLDLSKIAAGKLHLKLEPILLSSFIGDILALMGVPAKDKGLAIKCEHADIVPKCLETDPTRLRQVIINLIYNAIKFTERGEVTLKIDYDSVNRPEQIQFIVSDTGIGISPDDIKTVFRPFQQLEELTTKTESGAGLGLAIASELIRRMGGSIEVVSKLHIGSDFIVTLPVAPKCQQTLEPFEVNISDVQPKQQFAPLKGKVLVVDDIKTIRMLVAEMCHSFGLEVVMAENGEQALKIIESGAHDFACIVMDIHMPVMDGRKAIVPIRRAGFEKPVYALTAANMKHVDAELKELGFTDVISKPVRQSDLYSSLSAATQQEMHQIETMSSKNDDLVLVVEDDVDAAELIVLLLGSINVRAESVQTYRQCLDKLSSSNTYTHILLDKNLPDGNGMSLANYIHENHSENIRIILISGDEVSPSVARKHGISLSLLKPVTFDQLRAIFHTNAS